MNFLYSGAPKYWISAPSTSTKNVWITIQELGKHLHMKPYEKRFLLSPQLLSQYNVNTVEVFQFPGDVVISAAGATHGGFNLGCNLAEAVNFIDHGDWVNMIDEMTEFYQSRDVGVPREIMLMAESIKNTTI